MHQSHWRYQEQGIHQYRPQCLITTSLAVSRAKHPTNTGPSLSSSHAGGIESKASTNTGPSLSITTRKSLSMRIDPDNAYQVARSTNFISKPIYIYNEIMPNGKPRNLNKSISNPCIYFFIIMILCMRIIIHQSVIISQHNQACI